MAERKKNFTEFLEQEGEAGVENIATIYATTDVFTTIRQMSEEYGITESAVSKILEYAITNCLISYQTCLAIVEKSHRNQARHIGKGESKSTPSSKHYDKLLKKRMEYVRTMRGVVPIRVFQFYINNPLLDVNKIAKEVGFSVEEVNIILRNCIIFDYIEDFEVDELIELILLKKETFAQKSSAQKKLQAYVEYRKMYKKLIKELASLKYKVDTYDAYAFEEKDGETLEDLNRELESKKREIEDFKKLF